MKYYSTNDKNEKTSFKEVVFNGLASDGGLYMPEKVPVLSESFLKAKNIPLHEIGFEVSKKFIGDEINSNELQNIISDSLNFIIPLMPLDEHILSLELFHGPTLAFKDVGARFMAKMLSLFSRNESKQLTILTATSGDTGSAVANAFYEQEGIKVVILFPKNGVTDFQMKQMTSLGKNISAIAIEGTFDDCQRLVKKSFSDIELMKSLSLTSANSINIARLIPQTFYFLFAYSLMKNKSDQIIFSVPCGNFGNLTAGVMAKRMGMDAKFIAATNSNNVFFEYLSTGVFSPRPSQKTISNAMDVGNPSNFYRLLDLYGNSHEKICNDISCYSISDDETRVAMRNVFEEKKYILDPHSAVACAALKKNNSSGIFLATAHPSKFESVVEETTGVKTVLPERVKNNFSDTVYEVNMSPDFESLKEYLLS